MTTVLLIDGENFKGKIKSVFKEARKDKPIWHQYDFSGLLDKVLTGIPIKRKVFYFARVKEHKESKEKSKESSTNSASLKLILKNKALK